MKKTRMIILAAMLVAAIILIPSCGSGDEGGAKATSPFAGKEPTDLSGYHSMEDYDGESRLVETDVAEAVKLMNDKESFVLFFSFEDCPYCNAVLPYLNKAALEAGQYVGYVDTRKDPEWMTNMDIDDYDLVEKYFGEYLQDDEQGRKHLYTPDAYFIKKGKIVARHSGVLAGADDPNQSLTSTQEEELMKILAEDFKKITP